MTEGDPRISRRTFLKGLALTGAGVLVGSGQGEMNSSLASNPKPPEVEPPEHLPSPETEPNIPHTPLVVDFPPLPKDLDRAIQEGLLTSDTESFDIASFFDRLTGSSYAGLESQYQNESHTDWPLYTEEGIEYLSKQGLEKQALCLALASSWSQHGLGVTQYMQNFRDGQNLETQRYTDEQAEGTAQLTHGGEELPLEPYTILGLQDFVSAINKSDETDEFGNPYYLVNIDHVELANAISQSPQKVISGSINVGRDIKVRIGHNLPDGHLSNKSEGWVGGIYAGNVEKLVNGMVEYSLPPLALETAYQDPENLQHLMEFINILRDAGKIVVLATGNSEATLSDDFTLPDGSYLIGAWDSKAQASPHNFQGSPEQVYYIDPNKVSNSMGTTSSPATAIFSEWLSQQGTDDPVEIKNILRRYSKVQIETNNLIVGIGAVPNVGGIDDWNDPTKYRPLDN